MDETRLLKINVNHLITLAVIVFVCKQKYIISILWCYSLTWLIGNSRDFFPIFGDFSRWANTSSKYSYKGLKVYMVSVIEV